MARKTRTLQASRQAADLVGRFAREWARGAQTALPPQVRAHLRAAAREGLLAMATLWEAILRGAEEQTRRARRRVERIPIKGEAPSRPKPRGRRRRRSGRLGQ